MSVSITELTETCRKAIKTYGYDDDETKVLLDVMMYAQLRGNNQGIIKVTTGGIKRDPECKPVVTEHETKLSANLNGNKNAGMVVLHGAMEIAVQKAQTHGFGICGTNNTSTSTGALGFYAEQIAKKGLIGTYFPITTFRLRDCPYSSCEGRITGCPYSYHKGRLLPLTVYVIPIPDKHVTTD